MEEHFSGEGRTQGQASKQQRNKKVKEVLKKGATRKIDPKPRRKHKQDKRVNQQKIGQQGMGASGRRTKEGEAAAPLRKLSRSFQACSELSAPLLGVSSSWGTRAPLADAEAYVLGLPPTAAHTAPTRAAPLLLQNLSRAVLATIFPV